MTAAGSLVRRVFAWEALDSRGKPTVACAIETANGSEGCAVVPSGASTGTHESRELRDGGTRYGGHGVRGAVGNVNDMIAGHMIGRDSRDQEAIDDALTEADPSPGFRTLGANAVLAVSLAAALAGAAAEGVAPWRAFGRDGEPLLPMPMVNVVSGGAHAGGAVDLQDFLVVPVGASSFAEAIEWADRVRRSTAAVLAEAGHNTALVADEGGLAAPLASNRAALELLARGIERSGLSPGDDAGIAIDVAATQFFSDGRYRLSTDDRDMDADALVAELATWCREFPIVSVEDALAEDDWDGWATATRGLAGIQLLGDDLFVTDVDRLDRGIAAGVANAVLVKPNQTGTLTGARRVVDRAREAGYATVLSARSGETEDSWLADLAVGWRTGQIKVGSLTRSERTAKWNRLLRIEAELEAAGRGGAFAGRGALAPGTAPRPGPTGNSLRPGHVR